MANNNIKVSVKPYVHQDWPAMFYHPTEVGRYEICESEDDVPEGYVDNPTKVGKSAKEQARDKKPAKKKAPAKKSAAKKVPEVTLESLGVSRKEALEVLADEDVDYDDDIENAELALLVKDLLEDDDS